MLGSGHGRLYCTHSANISYHVLTFRLRDKYRITACSHCLCEPKSCNLLESSVGKPCIPESVDESKPLKPHFLSDIFVTELKVLTTITIVPKQPVLMYNYTCIIMLMVQ